MTLGNDLLVELDRRAKGGLRFDFQTRQELRAVDSLGGLCEFLQSRGFGDVPRSPKDVADLADYVCAVWATRGWRATRRAGMFRIAIGVLIVIAGWISTGSFGIAAITFGGLFVLLGVTRLVFMVLMPRRFGRYSVPLT